MIRAAYAAACAAALFAVSAAAAPAAAPTAPPAGSPGEEEQLDDGLRRFGYLAGLARGCVADAQLTALDREVLDLHAGISRLLGTDRAFLFASAFGYGTSVKVELANCADVLKTYEARVAKFRAGAGKAR